jgi:hypothetical protein
MLTNIKNSILTAGTFSLLSLAISNPSYGVPLNLTTFDVGGDATLDSANQATIRSGTINTLITGGGNIPPSLDESFLGLSGGAFDTLFPSNFYGSAIKKNLVSVNTGDVLTFNYDFTQDVSNSPVGLDTAFVTIGTDIFSLATSTSSGLYTYTFTTTGDVNLGIGVLDIDDPEGVSTLIVQNADITPVPYEFEMASGVLAFGVWLSRKKVMAKIKSWRSKG